MCFLLPPIRPLARPRELIASAPLPPDLEITEANRVLRLTFEGRVQEISLQIGVYTPAMLISAINNILRGGYARLTGGYQGDPPGRLAIGSDRLTTLAAITIDTNADLGFPQPASIP